MLTNKQLDYVFFFIKLSDELAGRPITQDDIWYLFFRENQDKGIRRETLNRILQHLVKEGYIQFDKNNMFILTVKGMQFQGFVNESKKNKRESNKSLIHGLLYVLLGAGLTWAITKIDSPKNVQKLNNELHRYNRSVIKQDSTKLIR